MLTTQFKNVKDIKTFLQGKIDREATYLSKFDKAREEGTLAYFMSWHGVDFHGATTQAAEARRYLTFIDGEAKRDDHILTDKEKFEIMKTEVAYNVARFTSYISINSRSTSMSSNLTTDFTNAFFLEFNNRFLSMY